MRTIGGEPPEASALIARAKELLEPLEKAVRDYEEKKKELSRTFPLNQVLPHLVEFSWPSFIYRSVAAFAMLCFLFPNERDVSSLIGPSLFLAATVIPLLGIFIHSPLKAAFDYVAFSLAGPSFEALGRGAIKAKEQITAIQEIVAERLDKIYEKTPSYPPDWTSRCAAAKKRDGYACQHCGWPKGGTRRGRQLQVHHIVSISSGGTHRLENLLTLCHMCHREIDADHRGVRRISRRGKPY